MLHTSSQVDRGHHHNPHHISLNACLHLAEVAFLQCDDSPPLSLTDTHKQMGPSGDSLVSGWEKPCTPPPLPPPRPLPFWAGTYMSAWGP